MRFLSLLNAYLLAMTGTRIRPKAGNTWLIDGNNLIGHKLGVTKDVDLITDKLSAIRGQESVVLILDGRKGMESPHVLESGTFQRISLAEGVSADEYILQQLETMIHNQEERRVQVVTADRKLRAAALRMKPVIKGVVNPVTFWKRYLPRLAGMKGPNPQASIHPDTEDEIDSKDS
jgi:hypothetical protein